MGLVAYGISGLILIVAAGVIVLGSLAVLDDAATGFERQRAEVVALLDPAAKALERAAASASNVGASLTSTRDAAGQAAQLTLRLAESYESLAALGSFDLLGTRPFGAVAGQFAAVAAEARLVSTDLELTSAAIGTNVSDSEAIAADVRALAARLAELRSGLAPANSGDPPASADSLGIGAARVLLLGLLAWLAIPAIFSLWAGWQLLRRAG